MLSKGMAMNWFRLFVAHGARGDIPDASGRTVAAIMRRKRDPEFQRLAEGLTDTAVL
jgi:hypothetical protein